MSDSNDDLKCICLVWPAAFKFFPTQTDKGWSCMPEVAAGIANMAENRINIICPHICELDELIV